MRKGYQYKILVDGKVVWKGTELKKNFDEITRKNPKGEIGIECVWGDDTYIL